MSDYSFPLSDAPKTDGAVEPGGSATSNQQPLTDRMAQGAHHTIDRLAETAAPHVDRLEKAVSEASQQLKSQARQARETGDEWADSLRTTVSRNPLAAVATALAVGALIARLTR